MAEVVVNVFLLCVRHEFVAQKMDLEMWKQMSLLLFGWGHVMLSLYDVVVQTLVVAKVALKGSNLYAKGRVAERTIVSEVGLFYGGVDVSSCQRDGKCQVFEACHYCCGWVCQVNCLTWCCQM